MSLKLDDAREALSAIKDRVSSFANETAISAILDPMFALKIVGIALGIVLIIIAIAIILHKTRASRVAKAPPRSKRTMRGAK